ncbi:hypothetical protein G9U51_08180 [Calidifontibacter sp. DB0510]|uniref:Uncharacterized protein n=1 Tax=Metallococcus carri TaxID=1656884 RepID=A0A967B512_9MICO|nr:hypothetical protein [Metallococcus carri]NHN55752.1 hypothetical protein [Metallococcus carri]NOP38559.1 hypothetical protein [Calidifontibacter sp. DB2511S]
MTEPLAAVLAPDQSYAATVTRVIDGDTLDADVTLGSLELAGLAIMLVLQELRIRLRGCNAAEIRTEGGKAAKAHLAELLPVGAPITLTRVTPYKYGIEVVAAIQTRTSVDLIADLIADQWVAPWDGTGTRPVPPWPRTV